MKINWNNMKRDNTTAGDPGGLYTPICPDGYVALGSVGLYIPNAMSDPTPADFPDLYCVRAGYATPLNSSSLAQIWIDHGTGAILFGTVWVQPALASAISSSSELRRSLLFLEHSLLALRDVFTS